MGHSSHIYNYWHQINGVNYAPALEASNKCCECLESGITPLLYLLEREKTHPNAPDILYFIGEAYEDNGEYRKAMEYYDKLLQLYPGDSFYIYLIETCKMWIIGYSLPENEQTPYFKKELVRINEKYLIESKTE